MPEKRTMRRVEEDRKQGKAPSTQAGEFVREEIEHIREGKHGARSTKQAIAIGLSKARRAGVRLPAPKPGTVSEETRAHAIRDAAKGRAPQHAPSRKRSQATLRALERESGSVATPAALSKQATESARKRTAGERRQAAEKAVETKGKAGLQRAAAKAARTRARHG